MLNSIGTWFADREAQCAAVLFGAVILAMCGVFFALLAKMWIAML